MRINYHLALDLLGLNEIVVIFSIKNQLLKHAKASIKRIIGDNAAYDFTKTKSPGSRHSF